MSFEKMFNPSYIMYFIIYLNKEWDEKVSIISRAIIINFLCVSRKSHRINWFRGLKKSALLRYK